MYSCVSTVKIDKKLIPFVSSNEKMIIEIKDLSSGSATVHLPLKAGVSPDMLEIIGSVSISFDLSSASQGDFSDETPNFEQRRKPALPYVENDYDEVRNKIGEELGTPVQTLFVGNPKQTHLVDKIAQTTAVEKTGAKQEPVSPHKLPVFDNEKESSADIQIKGGSEVDVINGQMQAMMEQMRIMQQMISNNKGAGEVVAPASVPIPIKKIDTIMNEQEFYEILESIKFEMPKVAEGRRLTRQECQEIEKYRLPKACYVISNCGQLFVNDVGITVRQSTAANLAGIPVYKLKQSGDLKTCFSNGRLKFVSAEVAAKMAETADISAAIEGAGGGLEAFVGYDGKGIEKASMVDADVTGTVDDSPISSRDIVERSRRSASRIHIEDVDEDYSDEQSSLVNLAGDAYDGEISPAAEASRRDSQMRASATRKQISRLDDW